MCNLYCYRCRRKSHNYNYCYYTHDIDGFILDKLNKLDNLDKLDKLNKLDNLDKLDKLDKIEYEYYNGIFIRYDIRKFSSPFCEKCKQRSHHNKKCHNSLFINDYRID